VKVPTGRTPLPVPLDGSAAGRPPRFEGNREAGGDATGPDRAGLVDALRATGAEVMTGAAERVEAGRDWWPLSVVWALEDVVPALPDVVCRPADTAQLAAVLAACDRKGVPVTPFAGASGVCGGSIPIHGGVSVDLTALAGVVAIDDESLTVDVGAGTFGPDLESALRARGLTLGHWPQSVELSTVGGWLACRGAGQYSTRYGKIEDMVVGIEVVLADGRVIRTGGTGPRAATGPDLTQLFVGCEGTLGVITEARLRVHPAPPAERRAAYAFGPGPAGGGSGGPRDAAGQAFAAGLDACRRILRRGATPAVLRLYDPAESARQFDIDDRAVLIVVDEGDPALIGAVMAVVEEECAAGPSVAEPLDAALAGRWLDRRNHLPPIDDLVRAGLVVDTVEIAADWKALPGLYTDAVAALGSVAGTIAASAHQSHAYSDGACLYFTFAGRPAGPGPASAERYYRAAFDAVTHVTMAAGGAVSHHHGIGLNRAGYLREHLGPAFSVLQSVKDALDPKGILNPGKLALRGPFGEVEDVP
jgi:alkyldihydroxyacetonephosphate synthase